VIEVTEILTHRYASDGLRQLARSRAGPKDGLQVPCPPGDRKGGLVSC
jgi:hypothetical protein